MPASASSRSGPVPQAQPSPAVSPARFAFLLIEDFTHLAFSCAIEPLRIANLVAGRDLYRWSLLSRDGTEARSSNGLLTRVDRGLVPLERDERLFVIAGLRAEQRITADILAFLRRERAHGRLAGAICSGPLLLAEAGLLHGEEVAIHWAWHDLMRERFPAVRVVPSVFVAGPRILTAAGGTAAADLMLHLIGRDHGEDLATEVADQMLHNAVREGSAQQRVSLRARHGIRNPLLLQAVRLFEAKIDQPPRPREVAAELGVSTRHLERLFRRHLGTSPRRYAMGLRLQRARNLILQSEQPLAEIAMASGFTSTSHFARAFRAQFGLSPREQRARLT